MLITRRPIPNPPDTFTYGAIEDFMQATVTLTDAQFKALPTAAAGFQVVAAVAGKIIQILAATFRVDASAGAYTNLSDIDASEPIPELYLVMDPADDFEVLTVPADIRQLLAHNVLTVPLPPYVFFGTPAGDTNMRAPAFRSSFVNEPVALALDNKGKGNLTGGHASNVIKVDVTYVLVDA